jgi:hypothetical protein
MNQRKDKIYDEIINEFASLNDLRTLIYTGFGTRTKMVACSLLRRRLTKHPSLKIEK